MLQRLLENRLFIKAEKFEFRVLSFSFLGFILEDGQVKVDLEKVQTVLNLPTPTSCKQLQRFLGFANFYRRFIKNHSQTALPLTSLTSPKKAFSWTSEAEKAFHELKQKFAQAPILTQPLNWFGLIIRIRRTIKRLNASILDSPAGSCFSRFNFPYFLSTRLQEHQARRPFQTVLTWSRPNCVQDSSTFLCSRGPIVGDKRSGTGSPAHWTRPRHWPT